jgi:cobalamin biosynthesis Mg chelatase CobN
VPVLVAACAALVVSVAPAAAKTPCWKLLLNDWYDGAITNTYPIPCYQQAIDHLPTDVDVYSSAREDIRRALQQAIAAQRTSRKTVTSIEPGTSQPGRTTTPATTTSTTATPTTTTRTTPTTTVKKKKKGPISSAIKDLTPGGADSFPLPLLILGFLAILLVLAGVGGMAWRRYQGRGP